MRSRLQDAHTVSDGVCLKRSVERPSERALSSSPLLADESLRYLAPEVIKVRSHVFFGPIGCFVDPLARRASRVSEAVLLNRARSDLTHDRHAVDRLVDARHSPVRQHSLDHTRAED